MNVLQIKNRVKRQFGDESGVQLTDSDIINYINDAQRAIIRKNENLLDKTAVSSSTVNIQEYAFPSDLLIFKFLMYKGSGDTAYRPLRGMSTGEFNEYIDGWDNDSSARGVPVNFTIHSTNFLVFPIPEETIASAFKLYYNRIPTDVAGDGDTPDLPILYHDVIVDLCLKYAYELDEDWEAAGNKFQEANSSIDILRGREDWKRQDVYPSVLLRVEDM